MNILFVCRYNRFRSQVAESFFHNINTNENLICRSAGLFRGDKIDDGIINLMKRHDLTPKSEPSSITEELLNWQDVIIVVGDNIPPEIFNDARIDTNIFYWNIKEKENDDVINNIKNNIVEFLSSIQQFTILIGLPASGKSTYMNNNFKKWIKFDDYNNHNTKNLKSSIYYNDLYNKLIRGDNIVINDILYCNKKYLDIIVSEIKTIRPNIIINKIYFENNISACEKNINNRNHKSKELELSLLNKLSLNYKIPKHSKHLKVFNSNKLKLSKLNSNDIDIINFIEDRLSIRWKVSKKFIKDNIINKSLKNNNKLPFILIAKINNEFVGKLLLYIEKSGYLNINNEPWISALYVKENYRGNNIGIKLMEMAKKILSERNFKYVYIDTASSVEYYNKLGDWELIGEDFWKEGNKKVTIMRSLN